MKTVTREIDGIAYHCQQLPATDGVRVFRTLTKIAGEKLIELIATADNDERTALLSDRSIIARLVSHIADNTADTDIELLRSLTAGMTCDQVTYKGVEKPTKGDVFQHFDSHFAGRYMHLGKVLWFAIEVNFANPT
jgi:hypothetical protein